MVSKILLHRLCGFNKLRTSPIRYFRDRRYNLDKPILASLVQLAVAILYDLGLDKPASDDAGLMLEYDLKGFPRPGRYERSPTLEERRALLGCFLLSSVWVRSTGRSMRANMG